MQGHDRLTSQFQERRLKIVSDGEKDSGGPVRNRQIHGVDVKKFLQF